MALPASITTFTNKVNGPGNTVNANDIDLIQTAINTAENYLIGPSLVNLLATPYNVTGNVRRVTDGAITSGHTLLSSATANFTIADTGKYIVVQGAGSAGTALATTMTYASPSTVTLAISASTTVSGATVDVGTDDAAAIQAAINACATNGGGTLIAPPRVYGLASMPVIPSNVRFVASGAIFRWIGAVTTGAVLSVSTTSGVVPIAVALQQVRVDANNLAAYGIAIHSAQMSTFVQLFVTGVTNAAYYLTADATSGGESIFGSASNNMVFNTFIGLYSENCPAGLILYGPGVGQGFVTDNFFYNCVFWSCTTIGIDFQQWCDSNHFYGTEISIAASNAIGIRFNTSTSTSLGVYDIQFYGLTVDQFVNGGTAFQFNNSVNQIYISQFYGSPSPWNGTLISEHSPFAWKIEAIGENPAGPGTVYTNLPPTEFVAGTPGSVGGTKLFSGGGSSYILLGDVYSPSPGALGGITLGSSAASSTNWTLLSDGAGTYINSPSTDINIRAANADTFGFTAKGHFVSRFASVTSAAAGTNAGTSPPSPIVMTNSTDVRGNVTFGTGTTPAAGTLCTVTYANNYTSTNAPFVALTPTTSTTPYNGTTGLQWYVTNIGSSGAWTGFNIRSTNAPEASKANTYYGFNYEVIG